MLEQIVIVYPWQTNSAAESKIDLPELNDIHLWQIDLTQYPLEFPNSNQVQQLLSSKELKRCNRLVNEKLRMRFSLSHAWKRIIIARYLKSSPLELIFNTAKYGKPFLSSETPSYIPALKFNFSHSADRLLLAISNSNEIGVDVEFMNPEIEALELAERFFALTEFKQLKNLSDKEIIIPFYRIWTAKEAVIKALGKGLSYHLSSFGIQLTDNYIPVGFQEAGEARASSRSGAYIQYVSSEWQQQSQSLKGDGYIQCLAHLDEPNAEEWRVYNFELEDNYMGAIASPKPIKTCFIWKI